MQTSEGTFQALHDTPVADAHSLRVAIFTDTFAPQVNGVARTLVRLSDAIQARGGVVRVFTTTDPGSLPESHVERHPSIPFWGYPELRLAWPSTATVQGQLERFRPSIVHVATPFGMGLAGRRAARELRLPLVSSYHTGFAAYARYYGFGATSASLWRYLRWFHNSTQRTYCPSSATEKDLARRGFRNTAIWSRGVDTVQFSPSHRSSPLRTVMGADESTLVVTYVGRLAAEKGLDVAVKALRLAGARRPGRIVFSCVGAGPFDNELRRTVPEDAWLPGTLSGPKLSEAYASGDVFIFPSTTDTFGNVLLEAMASGLPVIGADVGATRELVGAERGWLIEAGNHEAMADLLVRLVDNPSLLIRPSNMALEFAAANKWEAIWDGLLDDYVQVVRR